MDILSETTNPKECSNLKRFLSLTAAVAVALSLTGCAFFDNEARDKAACDRLSDVLTSQGSGSLPTDPTSGLVDALERDILPIASGDLGGKIKDLIDSYRGLESRSIFDQFAGGLDTLYYSGLVLERCLELSSSIP